MATGPMSKRRSRDRSRGRSGREGLGEPGREGLDGMVGFGRGRVLVGEIEFLTMTA